MSRAHWITVAILGFLFALKVEANSDYIDWWFDGGYYADIADHIAKGDGFVSDISIYHQGLPYFPHTSPVYPAWPLLLGLAAKLVGLTNAAVGLPTVFYFATLLVVCVLTVRIDNAPFIPGIYAVRPIHLALIGLGMNDRYFEHTSRPYTEGMGFFFLFLGVWPMLGALRHGGLWRGLAAGLWVAGLCLIRGPFVVVALAFALAMLGALLAGRERWAAARAICGTALGYAAVVWILTVWYGQIPGATPLHLIRFDEWRVQAGLSDPDLLGANRFGMLGTVIDSLVPAFSLRSEFGYYKNFGYLPYAAIVGIGWALILAWRSGLVGTARWIRAHPALALLLWLGLAQAAPLHVIHKGILTEWNFGMRHAIGAVTLVVPMAVWACRIPGALGLFAAFAVMATAGRNIEQAFGSKEIIGIHSKDRARRIKIGEWLVDKKAVDADLRVGHSGPQLIDRYAPGVHWIVLHQWTTMEDLTTMVNRDGLDLIALPADFSGEDFSFFEDERFTSAFFPVADVPAHYRVFAPAGPAPEVIP